MRVCHCPDCGGPVYLDYDPEPKQVVLCETCWEKEGERAAHAGEYAESY